MLVTNDSSYPEALSHPSILMSAIEKNYPLVRLTE